MAVLSPATVLPEAGIFVVKNGSEISRIKQAKRVKAFL
jgi:hypothetical protein